MKNENSLIGSSAEIAPDGNDILIDQHRQVFFYPEFIGLEPIGKIVVEKSLNLR